MADEPQVGVRGPGGAGLAARIGADVAAAATDALRDVSGPLRVDRLGVTLPAGASGLEIERAIRRAIAGRRLTAAPSGERG